MTTERGTEKTVNIPGTNAEEVAKAVVLSAGIDDTLKKIGSKSQAAYYVVNQAVGQFDAIVRYASVAKRVTTWQDGADIWHTIPRDDCYFIWTSERIKPVKEEELQGLVKRIHDENSLKGRFQALISSVRWVLTKGPINFP